MKRGERKRNRNGQRDRNRNRNRNGQRDRNMNRNRNGQRDRWYGWGNYRYWREGEIMY